MSEMPPHLREAIQHYIPAMEGWTTPERCVEMAQLILDNRPDVCVEIGVFGGRTLIAQAMALRENRRGIIIGIDPWKKEDAFEGENDANKEWWDKVDLHHIHRLCVEAIWAHNLDRFAVLLRAASHHCAALMGSIDMLLIDGNHSEIASCRDVQLYLPRVRHGGVIILDDCDWPSTKRAQDLIERECDVQVKSRDGHYKIYKKR